MSSSKLDYLSKYTSSNDDKKDRKKKKKKSKQTLETATAILHDSDNETPFQQIIRNEGGGDDDDDVIIGDEEEGPVVVDSAEVNLGDASAVSSRNIQGQWQEIDLQTGAVSTLVEREDPNDAGRKTREQRRHDSSSDHSGSDNNKHHRPPRRRFDSDSTNEDNSRVRSSSPEKRQRHDSDGEDSESGKGKEHLESRRRQRYDSDAEEPVKASDPLKSTNRGRHDSDMEDSDNERRNRVRSSGRHRHDSDDEDSREEEMPEKIRSSVSKRRRYDSDSDDSKDEDSRERMSSGHKAGLQHYSDFNRSEKKIQKRKHKEAQSMVDKYGMGETVYRDKDGRKTDKPPQDKSGKSTSQVELDPEAQRRLNQGKVQQQQLEAKTQEMVILQESAFARHQDDDRLEALRKSEIRKGDPMAQYAAKKQKKSVTSSGGGEYVEPSKPEYKGPPPKPNRYGIRPGYRWDGVDRGNGFEDKILAQKYSAVQKEEQAYRWRSADM